MMPLNVPLYEADVYAAVETIQKRNKTIITRRLIEEEISSNPGTYPRAGELSDVSLKMVISELVNKRQDVKIWGKRGLSWVFDSASSQVAA
jgi:hypothetical protein